MAVSYGAIGTTGSTTATTSVTAAYPTGISASTSKLYLVVTGRSNTANTSAAITGGGWTQVGAFEGGTGTWGVDTGTRRVEIWKKDTVTGSETGNVTVTLAGTTANTLYARIVRVEVPAGYLTTEQFVSGADTTAGTGFSAAASSNATFTTNDLVLIAHAGTTDTSTLSSVSLTASGITFGTLSSRATVAVTGGNDHRHVVYTAPVSTGSGSAAAPTFAYTGSASTSGPVGFLVITEVAPPVFTVQPTNQTVTEPATATFTTTVTGASSFQWQFRGAGAVDPQVLSVSNIALTTAQNQTPAVTVPADANAFIVGSEYYTNTLQTITFSGSGWMTVQGSGGDWDFNYANNAYAFGKITATGSQTLSVSGTRAYDEGPTCQIIWLKVEDPDDWVLDHQVDPPDASPTTLSVTVNSETGGLVVGIFGNFSTPAAPSGTTQVGSSQTTNGHTTLVYSVDSVGATTTTVTSASYNFPTLFAVSVKAASSAWTNVTDGTGGTTDDYTTAATSVAITGRQYRLRATGAGGTTDSNTVTLTVNASSGNIYTITPAGGIAFAGAPVVTRRNQIPVSGGVSFSGTSVFLRERVVPVSGGVSFAGTAPITFSNGAVTYTITPSGGVVFSGAVVLRRIKSVPISGGIVFTGTNIVNITKQMSPTGGISFSGTVPFIRENVWNVSGGVVFSGTAPITFNGNTPTTVSTRLPLTSMGQ